MTQYRIILIAAGVGFLATLGWVWHERVPSAPTPAPSVATPAPGIPAPGPVVAQPAPAASPAFAPSPQPAVTPDPAPGAGSGVVEADPMQEPAERKFARGGKRNDGEE